MVENVVVVKYCLICCVYYYIFFVKQKTAYEMRISDGSSDVCSSDLVAFIAKEADVVSSVMDDKLGVTVQEIKNFGQFLFEGRGALQEFVGETMDGESLGKIGRAHV